MSGTPLDRVERVLPIALAMVGAVREGPDQVAHTLELAEADMPAVMVALAALVPDDRSAAELLRWYHGERKDKAQRLRERARVRRPVAECGTRSGFGRHKNLCEPVCGPCAEAERLYQRERKRRDRAAVVSADIIREAS